MVLLAAMRATLVALGAAVASAEDGIQITDAHGVPEVPPRYDCFAEYDIWQTAWTPDWKAWCCENELRGCPSTTTTTATSSTQTTTTRTATSTSTGTSTRGLGCAAVCELHNVNSTCGDRIRWVTTHDDDHEKKPCKAAHALVLTECSVCGGCSMEEAGCESEEEEHGKEKQERTFMSKKFQVSGQADSSSATQGVTPLGFLARFSLAGLAAGVPLAIVFRRGLRQTASPRQAGLGDHLYQQGRAHGGEVAEVTE